MVMVFFISNQTRDDIRDEAANESLVILYESAWYQTYNNTYEVMSKWLPGTGDKGNYWDPDEETLNDEIDSEGVSKEGAFKVTIDGFDKTAIKAKMRELKAERAAALEAHDSTKLKAIRRHLHSLNHQIRSHAS